MAQVINTGGGDSGAGVAIGVLIAVVLGIAAYFMLVLNHGHVTVNNTTPDVTINTPASAPAAPAPTTSGQ